MEKGFTFYRLSKNKKWYRVHYENIKINDRIKHFDKTWKYLVCTSIDDDGCVVGFEYNNKML